MQAQTYVWNEEETTVRQWLVNARLRGEEDVYAGKRRRPRVTWQVPVTVEILDGVRANQSDYATSKDVSAGGMGLRCRRAIEARTLVRVVTDEDGRFVHARVMHCTETIGGFFIGVEFQPQQLACRTIRQSA